MGAQVGPFGGHVGLLFGDVVSVAFWKRFWSPLVAVSGASGGAKVDILIGSGAKFSNFLLLASESVRAAFRGRFGCRFGAQAGAQIASETAPETMSKTRSAKTPHRTRKLGQHGPNLAPQRAPNPAPNRPNRVPILDGDPFLLETCHLGPPWPPPGLFLEP